tara:strand:- start:458 stop:1045 length:588 start_codon:yes stop_codon:yes gene_type:complete
MLEIKGNEERIDETIEEITMEKNMFMHLNFVNAARHYTAGSFIKVRQPMDTAYTVNILNKFWGEEMTMQFIAMFEPPRTEHVCDDDSLDVGINYDYCEACEEERDYDCNNISNKALEFFADFCAAFKMLDLSTGFGRNETILAIEFINQNRDILIDEDSNDTHYIGRFTTIKDEGRWFTLTDELKEYRNKGEEEE